MPSVFFHPFAGLRSSVANANGVGSSSGKNLVRNRTEGYLQQGQGYADLFSSVGVPASDATKGISALVVRDFISFSVPDHPPVGAAFTSVKAVYATYTKTSHGFTGPVSVNTAGIFIRPYWDGAVWNDSWFELTEFYILKISSMPGGTPTIIDLDQTLGLIPAGVVGSDHLKGFLAVYNGDFTVDAESRLLVTASAAGATATITIAGDTTKFATRAAGDVLYLFRSNLNALLPNSTDPDLRALLSELRISSGNALLDTTAMVGFRTKSFGWATADKVLDNMIADLGCFNLWPKLLQIVDVQSVGSADPLDAGPYYLSSSIVMDDGSESALAAAATLTGKSLAKNYSQPFAIGEVTAVVCDTSFVYVAIYQVPGLIYKISKASGAIVGQWNGAADEVFPVALTYSVLREEIYAALFSLSDGTTPQVVRINPITMTTVARGAFPTSDATNFTTLIATDEVNAFVYVVFWGHNGPGSGNPVIGRLDPSTLAPDPTALVLSSGPGYPMSLTIDDARNQAYVTFSAGPGVIQRVNTTAWTLDVAVTLAAGQNDPLGVTILGTTAYIVCQTSPTIIIPLDLVAHTLGAAITLPTGFNYGAGIFNDGTNLVIALAQVATQNFSIVWQFGTPPVSSTPVRFIVANLAGTIVGEYDALPTELFLGGFFFDGTTMFAGIGTTAVSAFSLYSIGWITSSLVSVFGTTELQLRLEASPAITKRARFGRLYVSTDNVNFFAFLDFGLYDAEHSWDSGGALTWDSAVKHFYHLSDTITLNGTLFAAAVDSATGNLGRAITDNGVIRYLTAGVLGTTVFAGGVRLGNSLFANKIFGSIQHGSGVPQYDVFPNGTNVLDLEYNDGDAIIGFQPVGASMAVIKNRSLVILTPDDKGGFNRNIVSRGVGGIARRTIVSWDNKIYWLDNGGFNSFDMGSLDLVGLPIRDEISQMTPATKAAAVAVIDRNSKTYRCELNGVQYCFDLEDHKRGQLEWMQDVYADQVKRFAVDVTDGAVLFLDSTALKIEKIGAGTRHNGTNIAFEYTTTEADPQKVVDIDYIPRRVYLDYISDVPISVDIYLNAQSGSAWTLTFPAAKTEAWLQLGRALRCKRFHVKISAATSADAQSIIIKKAGVSYNLEPAGGDIVGV